MTQILDLFKTYLNIDILSVIIWVLERILESLIPRNSWFVPLSYEHTAKKCRMG